MLDGIYVVTGGAGFIGSHLCRALLERGLSVRVVDNFVTGKRRNLAALQAVSREGLDVFEQDIRNADRLGPIFEDASGVFHLAALTSVEESIQNPREANSVNIDGTLNVLEAARRAEVDKVVFASSTAVYGDVAEGKPCEEGMAADPRSPYAVTKLCGEYYCRLYDSLHGVPATCLRFFNVYGPRQDPASPYSAVVPRFLSRMLKGKPPIIFGDGEQTRDFVFVSDVVEACLIAASSVKHGGILNVASGASTSLLELVQAINQLTARKLEPKHEEGRAGEIRHSAASTLLAEERLGFRARVALQDGLRETIDWFAPGKRKSQTALEARERK